MPYEQVKADLLAHPQVQAAYDALETAQQIARLRLARGLTQAELAALVGTKQPSIARLEKGETLPSLAFLTRVASESYHIDIEPRKHRRICRYLLVNSLHLFRQNMERRS